MTEPNNSAHPAARQAGPATTNAATNAEVAVEAPPRERLSPATDILESPREVVLIADMPGVDEQAVDITLEKNLLTIRGHAHWDIPADFKPAYAEFALGDYERTFRLSDEIDRSRIGASMKNGVLRVTLPKRAPAEPRRIAVRAE